MIFKKAFLLAIPFLLMSCEERDYFKDLDYISRTCNQVRFGSIKSEDKVFCRKACSAENLERVYFETHTPWGRDLIQFVFSIKKTINSCSLLNKDVNYDPLRKMIDKSLNINIKNGAE